MPNKYNVRAKRQTLDNAIRDRAWNAFQTVFSELSSPAREKRRSAGGKVPAEKKGEENLCESVVQCRNHRTTHRTLLHSLCDIPSDSSPPPPGVIAAVASACPRSLLLGSGKGGTPLHLAIGRGASVDTVQALLEAAENDETLARQDLLLALDSKGQTPLLWAARTGASDDIVKYLVRQDAVGSSLLIPSRRRKKMQQAGVPLKYVASNESMFADGGLENSQDLLRFVIVRTYRSKWKDRFPSFWGKDEDSFERSKQTKRLDGKETGSVASVDGGICLLQATLFCFELIGSVKVAHSILSRIIQKDQFQRERLDSLPDAAGNLTLHIACLSETHKCDQISILGACGSGYGRSSNGELTLMEFLVNLTPPPRIAPYLIKNSEGDIPLHCALKNGKDWSDIAVLIDACPRSVQSSTTAGELPLHLAIKSCYPISDLLKIWTYHPEASSALDRSNGLYPFQMAAAFGDRPRNETGTRRSMKRTDSGNSWDQTSLSYFLLRECPSLLSSLHKSANATGES